MEGRMKDFGHDRLSKVFGSLMVLNGELKIGIVMHSIDHEKVAQLAFDMPAPNTEVLVMALRKMSDDLVDGPNARVEFEIGEYGALSGMLGYDIPEGWFKVKAQSDWKSVVDEEEDTQCWKSPTFPNVIIYPPYYTGNSTFMVEDQRDFSSEAGFVSLEEAVAFVEAPTYRYK